MEGSSSIIKTCFILYGGSYEYPTDYVYDSVCAILAGCSHKNDVKPELPLEAPSQEILSASPSQPSSTDETSEVSLPPSLSNNLQSLVNLAKADLAQQLSITESTINLVTAIEVTWPDTSLGCPQVGIVYSQVMAEGFLIHLEATDNMYEYHSDAYEQVVFCKNAQIPILPVPSEDQIQDGQPWVPAN